MKIGNEVLNILKNCRIEGKILYLPEGQLDRKLYMEINKVLTFLGGKWDRKSKGHVFSDNPSERLNSVIMTGDVIDQKKVFQFFETPTNIVKRIIEIADIQPDMKVLEPSAGKGALAEPAVKAGGSVVCVELNPDMGQALLKSGKYQEVFIKDFLSIEDWPIFDRVIMNPPFNNLQDIDHVMKAWNFLKSGGRLVAIMSESAFFRTTKKAIAFREWLEEHQAMIEPLPEGAFKSSGTMVRTRIVVIDS